MKLRVNSSTNRRLPVLFSLLYNSRKRFFVLMVIFQGHGMDRDFFLKEVCDVFHLTLEEKVTALLAGVVVVEVEAEDETVDTDRTGG